ncbi:caspase family protein [uncultured Tenacibaculum sp.]|uniref:caspase family protein n=1 Tax=uncultured Tenacibaculum sp. TaxID=174713 RepID=UPI002604B53F|nr:caspase family protein [uncultured Tenacibaculum sp.]
MENAYALLIGVGGENFDVTVRDAKSIYDVLIDKEIAGYDKNNVSLLTNEQATKTNILNKLDQLIEKVEENPNSTVIVYYSGHGIENKVRGIKDYYLVPHGADINDVDDTMIKGKVFSDKIHKIKSNKLLVLLDCCYAASIRNDTLSLRLKGNDNDKYILKGTNRKLLKLLHSGEGRVFISSCDDNELSAIIRGSNNSLFTEVILEVLKGETSCNGEYIHILDLMTHVIKEVPSRISKYNRIQRPIINDAIDLNPEFVLCFNKNYIDPSRKSDIEKNKKIFRNKQSEYLNNYAKDFENNDANIIQIIDNNDATIKNQVNIKVNHGDLNLS